MEKLENIAKMGKNFESDIVDRVSGKISDTIDQFVAKPSRTRWFLLGAAIGALGVIFLDPVSGADRRKAVREKAKDWGGSLKTYGQEKWGDLQERGTETRH